MYALQRQLTRLGACKSSIEWAKIYNDFRDAWRACHRGDWLLWLAEKLEVEHRVVVRAACDCARLALQFTRDERPLRAILMTERWASGDQFITLDDLKGAAEDCKEAALDAGCYGDFAGANTAYAARYACIAVLPDREPKEAAAACAEAVAEAAADAATSIVEGDAARMASRWMTACVVRTRIDEDLIVELWRRHVARG